MGRGRAKAKQAKVARKLKYSGGGTDLERRQEGQLLAEADYLRVEPVAIDCLDLATLAGMQLATRSLQQQAGSTHQAPGRGGQRYVIEFQFAQCVGNHSSLSASSPPSAACN